MYIHDYEYEFMSVHVYARWVGLQTSLNFLDFIAKPLKLIVLISLNCCGMVGVGLRASLEGENRIWLKNLKLK